MKRKKFNSWEAYFDNGREHSGVDAVCWAQQGQALGAGEVLLTSVDREGTAKGFDLSLLKAVSDRVDIPVVASGGMGCPQDLVDAVKLGEADAVAMAHVLHYGVCSLNELRAICHSQNIPVRDRRYGMGATPT